MEKKLKYVGNDVDLWEMAQIYGEMTIIWETAEKCGKWLRDLGTSENICWMASIHVARLKYLRNGLTMLEMAEEFDKGLKYVGNDVYNWELA